MIAPVTAALLVSVTLLAVFTILGRAGGVPAGPAATNAMVCVLVLAVAALFLSAIEPTVWRAISNPVVDAVAGLLDQPRSDSSVSSGIALE